MIQPNHVMISCSLWSGSAHTQVKHILTPVCPSGACPSLISQTSPLTLAPPAGPPHCSWFRKGESGLGMCSEPLGQGWIHWDWRGLMEVYNSHSSQRQESIIDGGSLRACSWIYRTTILGQKWIEKEIWNIINSELWGLYICFGKLA